MAFINNYKDNFLPSSHPWGDDNISVYNYSKKKKKRTRKRDVNPSDLGYTQLCDMITQLSMAIDTMPNGEDKIRIRSRLMALEEEKSKRDELEALASKDRDDAFDKKELIVKEDVVKPKKPKVKPLDLDDELLDLELDDIDDEYYEQEMMPVQQAGLGDSSNFLVAALIIICVISLTKK